MKKWWRHTASYSALLLELWPPLRWPHQFDGCHNVVQHKKYYKVTVNDCDEAWRWTRLKIGPLVHKSGVQTTVWATQRLRQLNCSENSTDVFFNCQTTWLMTKTSLWMAVTGASAQGAHRAGKGEGLVRVRVLTVELSNIHKSPLLSCGVFCL